MIIALQAEEYRQNILTDNEYRRNGIAERLGSIEVNKVADLILINGNPLEDIADMYKVEKVMLNGVWVK